MMGDNVTQVMAHLNYKIKHLSILFFISCKQSIIGLTLRTLVDCILFM